MEKKRKILLLEDLLNDVAFVKNALTKSNLDCQVLTVDTKEKFITALTEFSPDIILSDYSLPSFNSMEALKIVKQNLLDIPFIVVTATMTDEAAVELIMMGADDYILKDRLSRLPIAITKALEKFRLQKEHQTFVNELIKSEKRYKALIEHSADGVVILNAGGKPTYVSASVKNVLGYDSQQIQGMDIFTLMHPDDTLPLASAFDDILAHPGETMQGHTGRMLHKDGSWRWIEATVTNALEDPDIKGIIDNFRDVTEKKLAQDAIILNERQFRSLVENSKDVMLIVSETGKLSYISASIYNVLGYQVEERIGSDLFSLVHPEDRFQVAEIIEQAVVDHGVAKHGKMSRMMHKNGEWRWIEVVLTNMLHDNAINGFVGNLFDVTQRRLTDLLVANSEEKYRLLFTTSMDGILLTLPTGDILEANQAACDIFQMTQDEIVKAGRLGLVDIEDPRLNVLLEERQHKGSAAGEIFFIRKDGSRFPAEISSTIFKNAYGSEKTSMVIRDISTRKLAEQLLMESEQFNKAILASLSSHICVIDKTGTIIAVNKAWDDFGKANASVSPARSSEGSNYFEVCDTAIQKGDLVAKQALHGILSVFDQNSSVFEMEYRCDSPLEKRWFVLHVMKFGQDDSKLVLSHQNITELKTAGEKLELSEYSLRQAQAIAKIGSWEMDLRTYELTWSDQTYLIFEQSARAFKPNYREFLRLLNPNDRMAVDMAFGASLKDQSIDCIEHGIIASGAIPKVIEERWSVFKDENGHPIKLVGTCQDISRQKIAAETIVRSEANLNAIIENTDSFIYSLDTKLSYITYNSALSKSLKANYAVDLAVGYNIMDFVDKFDPNTSKEWKERYAKALGGEIVKFEKEFEINDYYSYTRFSIYPIWDNKNVIGLSCFVDDITKQKQADEQDRFQANLLNTIGQAVISTDLRGVIIYWNNAAEKIYGWTAQEALGENIVDLIPSSETKEQAENVLSELKRGRSWSGENRIRRKHGTYFPALIINSPVYNNHGELSGIIGVSTDITEKKALERLLDKATTLARVGSYEADLGNNVVLWSSMTKIIHEVDSDFVPEMKTGLNFFKEGHSRNLILAALDRVAASQTSFDLELQIVTAKGNERWVRVIGEVEIIDERIILNGSFQDIDKMKKAELEVLRAYEEKNIILESIGDAFFAVDKEWVVNYWNKEATRLLEQPKHAVLNKNLWEVFASSIGSESFIKYNKAVDLNQIVHFEDYYPPLERWLEVSAYPSANGLSVFFKDITERKLSEVKLNELNKNLQAYTNELVLSNKELEQFSYMVSHNLRAPVANIMGLGGLLRDDSCPSDLRQEFLKGIIDNVQRLDDVIVDLNLILQVKRQISEKNEKVSLQVLVENIQSSIQSLILEENVQITTDFTAAAELVTLKTFLHSIFYNLILNSIKYHQPGISPVIEISSKIRDDKFEISFKDNGLGIDLDKKKGQLFGLYKRFHHHVEGKGMGLFMVKTQVEMLGGTISVVSEINKGTTFLIEFNFQN